MNQISNSPVSPEASDSGLSQTLGLPAWTVDWNEEQGSHVLFKTLSSPHQLFGV